MRSVILCEGFDDAYILGYFLHKTSGWNREPKSKFASLYNLPVVDRRRERYEIYERENDRIAIWAVGGKDSFHSPYEHIQKINTANPSEGIDKVFIICDRDDCAEAELLTNIKEELTQAGIGITSLSINTSTSYQYQIEDQNYILEIIPIIIPFDKEGAIETILMDAIREDSEESAYVVEEAIKYIDNILESGKINTFLQNERLKLKAKYSSVISVTNPDRSTATFDTLLTTHAWHEKESIQKHFGLINTFLDK